MEIRTLNQASSSVKLETRAEGEAAVITGHAAVYYDGSAETEFNLWDGAVERIMPGAFDRAIKEADDVRALFNHDSNNLLGRSSAGTLTLTSDKRGLAYEITPGDTTVGRDVVAHVKRGDLQGSSFQFLVTDQDWRTEDSVDIREVRGVQLFDVGPVTFPAYESTTTGVRSNDDVKEAHAAWKDGVEAEEKTANKRSADLFRLKHTRLD